MKAVQGSVVIGCAVGLLVAVGCAGHDRDALHQPMEVNYADPADPMQRAFEDEQVLDARGRVEAPVQIAPETDAEPPEPPEPLEIPEPGDRADD